MQGGKGTGASTTTNLRSHRWKLEAVEYRQQWWVIGGREMEVNIYWEGRTKYVEVVNIRVGAV